MKNIKYIFGVVAFLFLTGCEDVIDVDLNTAAPRLVIDASINWQKGTAGNEQKIKLSTTAGYYETTVPPVSGAVVFITDSNGNVFNFAELPATGEYACDTFEPVLNLDYTLTVIYNGETYMASETLKPVVPIDFVTQRKDGGFTGEDIELKVFFTDDGTTDDYYLIRYTPDFAAIPQFEITEDEYYQGNQFSDFYWSEDLSSGDTVGISLCGISRQYYNYLNILGDITGGGGPFSSTPVNLKGNIVNATDFDHYAFGYFSLSETDSRSVLVE